MSLDRRDFLKMMGVTAGGTAGLGMLPPTIARALDIKPNNATGTIMDVEHVVILMQENRSFDHYFGTYNGVRGFSDPRPTPLTYTGTTWNDPWGIVKTTRMVSTNVFHQPVTEGLRNLPIWENRCGLPANVQEVLPFHIDMNKSGENVRSTCHIVASGQNAWNGGKYDNWIAAKNDVLTMGYLKYNDVSYHRHLANAFTICDHYHSSVHGDTYPNRLFLFSGTASDPQELERGKAYEKGSPFGGEGHAWKTYAERIEEYNKTNITGKEITWRVYQGGTGAPNEPTDNYGDNVLPLFKTFRGNPYQDSSYTNGMWWFGPQPYKDAIWGSGICFKSSDDYKLYFTDCEIFANLGIRLPVDDNKPLKPLIEKGAVNRTIADLAADVKAGKLPNVSWIVAPYKYCEHPCKTVSDGAYYINEVLEALTSNPEIWSKTVLFINYDENDGLFDHIVPPMPPVFPEGQSVAASNDGKVSQSLEKDLGQEINRGSGVLCDHPVGLGPRVPMLVISPWSKGGWVNSQVFDHASVLQFLEKRFGIAETNITPWRRAVCGDLTSAFDFSSHDPQKALLCDVPKPLQVWWPQPIAAPQNTDLPKIENPENCFAGNPTSNADGTRNARPLPYRFHVDGRLTESQKAEDAKFQLDFSNTGLSLLYKNGQIATAGETVGVHFYVYNNLNRAAYPKRYTIACGDVLSDCWGLKDKAYDLSVYGPNGYFCQFKGTLEHGLAISCKGLSNGQIGLSVKNNNTQSRVVQISSSYGVLQNFTGTGKKFAFETISGESSRDIILDTERGWYDLTIQIIDDAGHPQLGYFRHFAGHVETGSPSITDPLLTDGMMDAPVTGTRLSAGRDQGSGVIFSQ